jgi:hypothetical protein
MLRVRSIYNDNTCAGDHQRLHPGAGARRELGNSQRFGRGSAGFRRWMRCIVSASTSALESCDGELGELRLTEGTADRRAGRPSRSQGEERGEKWDLICFGVSPFASVAF